MKRSLVAIALLAASAAGFAFVYPSRSAPPVAPAPGAQSGMEVATFAGGCFWSMEYDFDHLKGVTQTISGFMGGRTKDPTYDQVSMGNTGHAESVQVTYDPKVVSYPQLVDYYWHHIDPLDSDGQFCDQADEYRPVIFVATPEQKRVAEASKKAIEDSGRFASPIAVTIVDAGPFTAAEEYHQDYHLKNPAHYHAYRVGCGRDARTRQLWGDEASTATH
jgi:peptide-methionine (S)-S-oxide reductase